MKVAHVVTYISPDGAFGGPVRVALGQAEALAALSHEVTVFAAAPTGHVGEKRQDGYTLRTFTGRRLSPGNGFATMSAPRLTRTLRKELAKFDVVHIHLARDLVTLPAAQAVRRAGVPYVLQPHGMIDASDRIAARPLDFLVTKPVLRDAGAVLVLTASEEQDIRGIVPSAAVRRIGNGIKVGELPSYEHRENLVLFLARLQRRKRPTAFIQMAEMLRDALPSTRFVLVGPDEGEGEPVLEAIGKLDMGDRIEWIGPVSPMDTDALLSSARVYVLPSYDEVFPMTILEALRVGTPVVTTHSLGIAEACLRHGAARITDGSPRELSDAVLDVMSNDLEAQRLRAGGIAYLRGELDIARVAQDLDSIYGGVLKPKARL